MLICTVGCIHLTPYTERIHQKRMLSISCAHQLCISCAHRQQTVNQPLFHDVLEVNCCAYAVLTESMSLPFL